jgi:tetratricopeptide (TPR) repeat protein
MSLPTQSEEPKNGAPSQTDQRAAPLRPRGIRPLTWILLLAIIGPCAVQFVPNEMGRWHLTRAIRLRENGQKEAANRELAVAMERFPNNPSLLLRRAEWQLADGNREGAIADADRMLDAVRNSSAVHSAKWLNIHSLFLWKLGEFSRAVEDCKQLESLSERSGIPERATALNGLAYAQALANIDLDEALANVNQALELRPASEAMLDTRGFIYFRQGEYSLALKDLDEAVKVMDREAELARKMPSRFLWPPEALKQRRQAEPRTIVELAPLPSDNDAQIEYAARAAAVGHYHRSLVLSALGRNEDAEKDLEMVRKLIGREPDETLF